MRTPVVCIRDSDPGIRTILPEGTGTPRRSGSSFRLPARLYTLDDKGVHPPRLTWTPNTQRVHANLPAAQPHAVKASPVDTFHTCADTACPFVQLGPPIGLAHRAVGLLTTEVAAKHRIMSLIEDAILQVLIMRYHNTKSVLSRRAILQQTIRGGIAVQARAQARRQCLLRVFKLLAPKGKSYFPFRHRLLYITGGYFP